ncbi:HK97 family phage major capsid protein [Povalibacter uvarum]|uniref:HK97 family phage major capsid protein n=1 Tax=Povalibacter uvarum TaxID=732238 RepID=A0A841HH62_9GAMM|nr:phage major capsid protein [Povalibacter uvarum]MBB6091904.1 HK97 family phage major capsid protein [Povalibacter uvarum]
MPSAIQQMISRVEDIAESFQKFKKSYDERVEDIEKRLGDRVDDLDERVTGREALEAKEGAPHPSLLTGGASEAKARKAFNEYLHKNDPSLLAEFESKDFSIAGGVATGSATVPEVIASMLYQRAVDEAPLINEVTVTPSSTGDYKRNQNRKGMESGWVGETDTRTKTGTPTLRLTTPPGGEVYAYPKATSWSVQDSMFDLGSLLIGDAGEEFGSKLEDSILFGNGTNKPEGMLYVTPTTQTDASNARAANVLRYVTAVGSPNTLDADVLINALFDLKAAYRRNAAWVMNSVTLAYCRKLKDLEGRYIFTEPNNDPSAPDGRIFGKRVVTSEKMQDVGAGAGNFPILVGDLKRGYERVDVGSMLITRDDNITEPGFVKWYMRRRHLGRILDNDAVRAIRT